MLQLANSYMNLAVPTSFASIAVGVRFMQRQGVPLAAAVTSGTINTLANNIVQGVMLAALLLFSGATLNLDIGTPSASGATHILLLLLGLLLAAWALIALLGYAERARSWVRGHFNHWWPEVRSAFTALRASNKLGSSCSATSRPRCCSRPRSASSRARSAFRSRSPICSSST